MINDFFLNKSHFEDWVDTISKYSSFVTSYEKIKKLFLSRDQYILYRLFHLAIFICNRCKNQKKSNLIIYVKNKSEKSLCNNCYDHFVFIIFIKKMNKKSKYNNIELITIINFSSKAYTFTHIIDIENRKKSIYDIDFDVVNAIFCVDEIFVIRHKSNDRAIAINDDKNIRLAFFDNIKTISNYYWKCEEKNKWIEFKHERRYLSHDDNENYRVEMKHYKFYEYFCAKKHSKKKYYFLILHDWVFRKMIVEKNDQKLIEINDENAL